MHRFFLFSILSCSLFQGISQEIDPSDSLTDISKNYAKISRRLSSDNFNGGLINDPALLWRGKIAGLGVYKTGDNPNATPELRIRGLSTLEQNANPLIVIDGLIGASLESIDPYDIASLSVLKDASATALYGIRGARGVIIINTKHPERNSGLTLNYQTHFALSQTDRFMPVMGKDEFIQSGGNDLGSEKDWQDEVTQTAFSNTHHISISGSTENTSYRASVNYRNVEGILKTTGFEKINVRAGIKQYMLNDRLTAFFNVAFSERENSLGYSEAFRYAIVSNPSSPVRFENGNYYQPIIFDNFNPVAILDLNENESTEKLLNFSTGIDFEIMEGLTVSGFLSQQSFDKTRSELNSPLSYFRGLGTNGRIRNEYYEDQTRMFQSSISYQKTFQNVDLNATIGYMYQYDEYEQAGITLGNFPGSNLEFLRFQNSGDLILGAQYQREISNTRSPKNDLSAFFGHVNIELPLLSFKLGLRREGSSKLGENSQWGMFPSLGASVDLAELIGLNRFDYVNFRLGYGISGGLPDEYGLSQPRLTYEYFLGEGFFRTQWVANPDLAWEKNKEINAGIDFGYSWFSGSLDVYKRNLDDLITEVYDRENGTTSFQNAGALETKGIEITLSANNLKVGSLEMTSSLVLSSYNTILKDYAIEDQMIGYLGAPGQGSSSMVRLTEGEELGKFFGPVFSGNLDTNGFPIFEDINNDGILNTDPGSALIPETDYDVVGNAIPSLELGFSHQIKYNQWDVNFFLRGVLGHSKSNMFRLFYEPVDVGAINAYNRVNTEKAVEGLSVAYWNSMFVENASFLTLENVSLGYSFNLDNNDTFQKLRLAITAQSLFTLTGFTGISPEFIPGDFGPNDNGSTFYFNDYNPLVMGVERRNTYFRAKTYSVNVIISF